MTQMLIILPTNRLSDPDKCNYLLQECWRGGTANQGDSVKNMDFSKQQPDVRLKQQKEESSFLCFLTLKLETPTHLIVVGQVSERVKIRTDKDLTTSQLYLSPDRACAQDFLLCSDLRSQRKSNNPGL